VARGQEANLLLRGLRFDPAASVSVVRVHGDDRTTVVAQRGIVTETSIEVTIPASELNEPGQLEFTVVNPDAAGGPSNSKTVDVDDIEAAAEATAPTAGRPRERRSLLEWLTGRAGV
jgi:IPT/TIG domain